MIVNFTVGRLTSCLTRRLSTRSTIPSFYLNCIDSYGVRNSSCNLFKSHLNLRKQKCIVNGSLSSDQYLTCVIPQGTTLGHLLFILCINDLPNCLTNVQYRMYADDTHLTFSSNNVTHLERALMTTWPKLMSGLLLII